MQKRIRVASRFKMIVIVGFFMISIPEVKFQAPGCEFIETHPRDGAFKKMSKHGIKKNLVCGGRIKAGASGNRIWVA